MNDITKLIISILFDIFDFTIGRFPVFGTVFDTIGTYLAYKLWGNIGYLYGLEILDFTDQVDAEIPTMTIIALLSIMSKKLK